jgi:NhaP-type Na+/H+ or K+/H+ antiporter
MESFATTVALIGIVIIVASLLSGVLERSGFPIVAVFLALGAALGPYGLGFVNIGFESPALHALAMLALALVLFSDAVTIDVTEVSRRKPLLWRLLGPGTLAPALLVAVAARFLLGVPWTSAAILGAALASTDPVLLRSVLRSRAFPTVSRIALRIETGMNDVVLLPIVVLSIIAVGGTSGVSQGGEVARSIVGLFLLGPALGALVGWLGIILLEQVRSRFTVRRDYESLYAIGLALSAFAFAESVGGSGFLAAFAAGVLVSSQDVELCDCFLEYGEATAEMLLLLTFVALGTSLIWTGLILIDFATVVFAIIALTARTIVLYPVLTHGDVIGRERKLIALFGPRGLSSLLLVLLAVFAGVPGAERLFSVACLVVLGSVVLHGTGIAVFLRRNAKPKAAPAPVEAAPVKPRVSLPVVEEVAVPAEKVQDKITIDEVRALQAAGEEVILIDARADRNRRNSETQAAGSIRVHPHEPVEDAKALRLNQRATLVVYCA